MLVARYFAGGDPIGFVARAALLVEMHAIDAVGITLERERAAFQMRQDRAGDAQVIVNDIAFGEIGGGI